MPNPVLNALVTVSLEASDASLLPTLSGTVLQDVQKTIGDQIVNFMNLSDEQDVSSADVISDASNFCLNSLSFDFQHTATEVADSSLKVSVVVNCECDFDLEVDGEDVDVSEVNLEGAQKAWEKHVRKVLILTEFFKDSRNSYANAEEGLMEAGEGALGLRLYSVGVNVGEQQAPALSAPGR